MRVNEQAELEGLRRVAELMCVAARTAPKAGGRDNLVTAIVEDEADRQLLADRMKKIAEERGPAFFARDADNLMAAQMAVIIGTRLARLGLDNCNLCGFEGCAASEEAGARCAFTVGDLGIAIGSAVSVAADHRVDNRVMYSVGVAAVQLEMLGPDVEMAHGIPLSATAKNIFFDRK
jgi:uncharacterized ferredoxin-like protein